MSSIRTKSKALRNYLAKIPWLLQIVVIIVAKFRFCAVTTWTRNVVGQSRQFGSWLSFYALGYSSIVLRASFHLEVTFFDVFCTCTHLINNLIGSNYTICIAYCNSCFLASYAVVKCNQRGQAQFRNAQMHCIHSYVNLE